nr:hypothetical protein Iba_chr02aCG10870 [Ipomoea batatas]GME17097.1 hypothetical protein Iba_scaffold18306CG0020 [Ipomoea batatas]
MLWHCDPKPVQEKRDYLVIALTAVRCTSSYHLSMIQWHPCSVYFPIIQLQNPVRDNILQWPTHLCDTSFCDLLFMPILLMCQ